MGSCADGEIVKNLKGMGGVTVETFGQGFKDMSPLTKELMKLMLKKSPTEYIRFFGG